ncbi:MAG: hypothetical protein ACJ8F3_20210 [Xanthobacteraceae bacterium]
MMTEPSLSQLEREVEAARARLAADIARLRSPETSAELTDSLKQEALDAKDMALEKAKTSVQSSIDSFIEDVKRRAAANPAAALAIGAGIGWRLLRHPPIATALVGAGLVSLFRTTPARVNGHEPADYLAHAKVRLRQQVSDAAEVAKDKAVALGENVSERATELAGAAKERAQDMVSQAAVSARGAIRETQAQAGAALRQTAQGMQDLRQEIGDAATLAVRHASEGTQNLSHSLRDSAGSAVRQARYDMQDIRDTTGSSARAAWAQVGSKADEWSREAHAVMNDADMRDKLLLGAAGLAVAAALGFAWQRREDERV